MSNPSDWMQINFDDVTPTQISPATTTTSNPSIDQGRLARPIRRRSRASRRTPTTLLNTDTTNFRAMVQQFTGSPTTTTTAAARPQLSNVVDFTPYTASTAVSSMSPAGGFPLRYPILQEQQRHHMFVADNMHGGGVSSRRPPESSPTTENHNYDDYMF